VRRLKCDLSLQQANQNGSSLDGSHNKLKKEANKKPAAVWLLVSLQFKKSLFLWCLGFERMTLD
jgi:hypothetical protein